MGGQSECSRMSLPMRGVADCKKWCTAPISDYTANKNSMAGSCGCEKKNVKFCNYDYGTSGSCQSCPREGAQGCDRMSVPWRGADDCRTWCDKPGAGAGDSSSTVSPLKQPLREAVSDDIAIAMADTADRSFLGNVFATSIFLLVCFLPINVWRHQAL